MRYKRIRSIIMAGVLGMLNVLFAYSQPADSLGYYLELAARNNPQINADFSLYKASLEKVPQAGAYPDPGTGDRFLPETDGDLVRKANSGFHLDANVPLVRYPEGGPQRGDRDGPDGLRTIP